MISQVWSQTGKFYVLLFECALESQVDFDPGDELTSWSFLTLDPNSKNSVVLSTKVIKRENRGQVF